MGKALEGVAVKLVPRGCAVSSLSGIAAVRRVGSRMFFRPARSEACPLREFFAEMG